MSTVIAKRCDDPLFVMFMIMIMKTMQLWFFKSLSFMFLYHDMR